MTPNPLLKRFDEEFGGNKGLELRDRNPRYSINAPGARFDGPWTWDGRTIRSCSSLDPRLSCRANLELHRIRMEHHPKGTHTTLSTESLVVTFECIFLQLRHLSFPFFPAELFPRAGLRTRRTLCSRCQYMLSKTDLPPLTRVRLVRNLRD